MKVKIVAEVPTVYQMNSIYSFRLRHTNKTLFGGYYASEEFDTIDDARRYLAELADEYYEYSRKERRNNFSRKDGWLRIDACTAKIERINK